MRMNKMVLAPLAAAVLMTAQMSVALADDPIRVFLRGKLQSYEQAPIIKDGSTLVPMRAVFEALGASVQWDGENKVIDAHKGDRAIRLKIGWKGAYIGQNQVPLDIAPEIINGSTMVPLRFIGEALGETVEWAGDTRSVLISTDRAQVPQTQPNPSGKAQTAEEAEKLVEALDPGNFTAFHDNPNYDLTTEDGSFYYYINFTAALGAGGDLFVEKGTGAIFGVDFTGGTETDPNAPFPNFSIPVNAPETMNPQGKQAQASPSAKNKAQTPQEAVKLVEALDPGNFTAFHDNPNYDLTTEDGSFYYYINYTAAFGTGGDLFVEKGTGAIFGVDFTGGTETDPNAPFPDFSIKVK